MTTKRADWESRWKEGRLGFHQSEVNPRLAEYLPRLVAGHESARVLVPLAGKSLDMVYLVDQGHTVLGVELVEQAVLDFFKENDLCFDRTGNRFAGDELTIWVEDIFELGKNDLDRLVAVYDRAAIIALTPDLRADYVRHLSEILDRGSRILLLSVHYDESEMSGPPFSLHPNDVIELYRAFFEVEQLQQEDILDRRFEERGLSAMTETTWLLTKL